MYAGVNDGHWPISTRHMRVGVTQVEPDSSCSASDKVHALPSPCRELPKWSVMTTTTSGDVTMTPATYTLMPMVMLHQCTHRRHTQCGDGPLRARNPHYGELDSAAAVTDPLVRHRRCAHRYSCTGKVT